MFMVTAAAVTAAGDSIMKAPDIDYTLSFPDMTEKSADTDAVEAVENMNPEMQTAIWPFGKKDEESTETVKAKSPRKAFFLSFLLPGLGETYVGSKRGLAFMAVEALSWYLYVTNTNEGKDLEDDFQRFADANWHYTDEVGSQGQALDNNYWKWLQYQFRQVGLPDDVDPYDYATVNSQLETTVQKSKSPIFGHSIHNLPSTNTQQYYEMIGKYPQFVYGWEDVDDTALNPTIRDEYNNFNQNVAIDLVKSNLRVQYEDKRDKSNDKLKAGQRGIHIMILNRVISAVHAARMAYNHNKKLESDLSTIQINFAEKHIIDNKVPMLMITKRF